MVNEKRLIDLDKIKPMDFPSYEMDGLDVVQYLNTLPTVDAVEVVRCKACKQWSRNSGIAESPNGHCFCHDIETNGCDFCSYGERRTDELP